MMRMTEIIKTAAEYAGLAFYTGFAMQMADKRLEFPLLWLEPIIIKDRQGLNEGTITYGVKFHLLIADRNMPQEKKVIIRNGLEKTAMELYGSVIKNPYISDINKLSCSHNTSSLTNYGEIGLTVAFDADKLFCNEELSFCETE